jgi:hypothetical protein
MAAASPRFAYLNQAADAEVEASSEDSNYPALWAVDQMPDMPWRSAAGWTIVTGYNDAIDFTYNGSDYTAVIAAGTYATAVLFAAAVVAALEAAVGAPTWAVAYGAATYLFTISVAGGDANFTLNWASGSSVNTAADELGFDLEDTAAGKTVTSDNPVTRSKQYLSFHCGGDDKALVAIVFPNLSADGEIRVWRSATNDLTAATLEKTFTYSDLIDAAFLLHYFSTVVASTYWWVEVVDCGNVVDDFAEIGWTFIGDYVSVASYTADWGGVHEEMTEVGFSDQGRHYVDEKPIRTVWNISFKALTTADRDTLITMANAQKVGRNILFSFDGADGDEHHYVYRNAPIGWTHVPTGDGSRWAVRMSLAEVK